MSLLKKTATEVQNLTWALADDMITRPKLKRLEKLLLAEPDARQLYVQCMQMQADLYLFFNPEKSALPKAIAAKLASKKPAPTTAAKKTKSKTSPVLKSLSTGKSLPGHHATH